MGNSARNAFAGSGIPWVTYALLVAFVIVFHLARAQESAHQDAVWAELAEAKQYLLDHPLLETPPILEREVGEPVRNLRAREERARLDRGAPPIPEGVLRRQQAELDRLVAQATEGFGRSPVHRWGVTPTAREPLTWATYAFFHKGWLHLLANGFLILMLGFYLEVAWGSVLYTIFVIAATVASVGFFTTFRSGLDATLIGSTGLLAALLGAFLVRMSKMRGDPAYWLVLVLLSVRFGLTGWLGTEWSVADAADGTASAALAPGASLLLAGVGFAIGVLAAIGIRVSQFEEAFGSPARDARLTRVANPLLEKALQAQSQGRMEEAFRVLKKALEADESDCDAALAMWDLATCMGRPADAAAAMLRLVRDAVQRGDSRAAVDHWLELEERGLSADADLTLLIRMAQILKEEEQPAAALGALQRALSLGDPSRSAVVASRVARAARDLDPDTAEAAAWQALHSLDLDFEERVSLEEMLGELHATRGDAVLDVARTHAYGKSDPRQVDPPPPGASEECALAGELERPEPIDLNLGGRGLDAELVSPLGFDGQGLRVEAVDGTKRTLDLRSVDAVAVAAVHGLGPKPVILVDLVRNWVSLRDEPLEVVRMRGDHFDPRRLSPGRESPLEALRDFLANLQEHTSATPLPDLDAARGRPFAVLDDLATYHRDVLMVDEDEIG